MKHIRLFTVRYICLLLFLVTGVTAGYAQPSSPSANLAGSGKLLIKENLKTGKADTIMPGNHIKLWIYTNEIRKIPQTILKHDFNRHTWYIESRLDAIEDSFLFLRKKQRLNFLPFKAFVRSKNKVTATDTIRISEVTKIRKYNQFVSKAIQPAVMMPSMLIAPVYFTTLPGMLYVIPAISLITNTFNGILYPMSQVGIRSKKYCLRVANPLSVIVSPPEISIVPKTDQWISERSERRKDYEKTLVDQLLNDYKGNRIISVSLGSMFIPSFAKGDEDKNTKVGIADKKNVFGLSTEYFITQKDRIGMEVQLHTLEKSINISDNQASMTLSGGSGYIFSIASYIKFGLGGIYRKSYRKSLQEKIALLDHHSIDENIHSQISFLESKSLFEPKAYFLIGAGAVNTILVRMKGSMTEMRTHEYTQQKFLIESGFGLFGRLGQRITSDLSLKYQWSPDYSPAIGGLDSYSGIKIQLNIGYMIGPAFARKRSQFKEPSVN